MCDLNKNSNFKQINHKALTASLLINFKCDGVREKCPYFHLVKIQQMASPDLRATIEQNAFHPARKFQKSIQL